MKSKQVKRVFPPRVQIYFTGRDKFLKKKLDALAEKHGMSSSTIGTLAIRLGLPLVQKNLVGLIPDEGVET